MKIDKIDPILWEQKQKSIPFEAELPDKYKVHDKILECPKCDGELFGRCLCCQLYFCHGDCTKEKLEDRESVFNEDDLLQILAEKGNQT